MRLKSEEELAIEEQVERQRKLARESSLFFICPMLFMIVKLISSHYIFFSLRDEADSLVIRVIDSEVVYCEHLANDIDQFFYKFWPLLRSLTISDWQDGYH